MNSNEYVKNVVITEMKDFSPIQARMADIGNIRLIHASAGITSEIAELFELERNAFGSQVLDRVNLMEECGDILWYIGIACDALGCTEKVTGSMDARAEVLKNDADLGMSVMNSAMRLAEFAGEFADLAIKKKCFYGKAVNDEDLSDLLARIHETVSLLCDEAGYSVEYARERNIAKLKARYGEKFSEAAALERNLENERKILENK